MRLCKLSLTVLLLMLATVTQAQTVVTFSTDTDEINPGTLNQGWWSPTVPNDNSNYNYLAGYANTFAIFDHYNDFFTFDLSSVTPGTALTNATLHLQRYSQSSDLTLQLFDVSTDAATLNAKSNTSNATRIYNDLGSGISYGSFFVPNGDSTDILDFSLNSAGLADMQAHEGTFFSIGGTVTSPNSYIFSGSGYVATPNTLTISVAAVPEPGSLALLATSALISAGFLVRRRKNAHQAA